MAPVKELRVSPVGNAPPDTEKVSGAMPPELEIPVFTFPTAIPANDVEVMLTTAAGLVATVPE